MSFEILHGDCAVMMSLFLDDNSVDAIVCDPPYGLGFMGKEWDHGVPAAAMWREALRVLKPGGYLLAFAGTRTQHRMACNIEDAGFEIRDMIAWVYGSGFPKSLDVSKAIDAQDAVAARRARQLSFTEWMRGAGISSTRINELTATNMGGHYLTAAAQPAVATREHFEALRPHLGAEVPAWIEALVDERTVESENMKRREVVEIVKDAMSGWSMDGTTKFADRPITTAHTEAAQQWAGWGIALKPALEPITVARKPLAGTVAANVLAHGTGAINVDGCRIGERWPANLIHDGSDEVLAAFPESTSGSRVAGVRKGLGFHGAAGDGGPAIAGSSGSAARFFYCAKASKSDRGDGNVHPTVKPTDLMRYLCRLVTPPGGLVLDPFLGSGSTGKAAVLEGFRFVGCELSAEYVEIARARIAAAAGYGAFA